MTRQKGYQLARLASENSDFGRNKTGAVAIYNNKVLAIGWNSQKTSSLQANYNQRRGFDSYYYRATMHAEMMVISKIRYLDIDFSQVRVFVWRGTDVPKMSRPCVACEAALRDLGICKVFYTGDNSFISEVYN